jgi:peptidoglycan/xylan/chitin deacetylase (PgdA/CDA1 family)
MIYVRISLVLLLGCFLASPDLTQGARPSVRLMAITIDDLPYLHVGPPERYIQSAERGTREILRVLRAHRAHAVGFVNEGKLWAPGQRDRRIALLKQWIDAGMTLGNHTYSHPDLNTQTVEQFQREILSGEKVTRQLMAAREPYRRFFRHPMTHTGDTRQKKEAIDRFLTSRGYTIAPHTIENSDFLFNVPYAEGRQHNDAAFAKRIRDLYLDYTLATTAFAEQLSVQIFGREIPQTLLIHANDITADTLDEMLARFEGRGYRFISLDEVMADPAYQTPDTHVSAFGPTWLVRWARSLNKTVSYKDEPEMPALPSRRAGG